jgi:hypothetical protein
LTNGQLTQRKLTKEEEELIKKLEKNRLKKYQK